jgi:hypothetical protein
MPSAATIAPARGRHRLGRPGLVHVTAFVTVLRRGLFESWRIPGRHRRTAVLPDRLPSSPAPGASAASGAYAV